MKAKADPDPRGLEGDEICIDMANQERVDMKSESNIIVELFFSASGLALVFRSCRSLAATVCFVLVSQAARATLQTPATNPPARI